MSQSEMALMAHLMRRAGFGANRHELEERKERKFMEALVNL